MMRIELTDEALDYEVAVRKALEAAGGDELAPRGSADPAARAQLIEPVLEPLGVWDLDPRASADELEAAAAVCRAAGWWAVPYPVAERLAGALVVDEVKPSAAVGAIDREWEAVTVDGARFRAKPRPLSGLVRKNAYVVDLDLTPVDGDGDAALSLLLRSWTLLGMVDRAMAMTIQYVNEREQFGQPIGRFQGVQFQLTDAEVERAGFEELAKYALWSVETGRPEALDDVLALRVAAIEAADLIFRVSHQLFGAIGFCDETPISWVSRASVPFRRLPHGLGESRRILVQRLGRNGLVGLFGADAFS
jgi:hypothetical protein